MAVRRSTVPPVEGSARRPLTTKGRDTRQRLLSAATSLFAERGYAAVRISDITTAAGLSPGAFYRYFTDRRTLMLALIEEMTAEAFDFVRVPWDQANPMDSVLRSTQLYFEFYESHAPLFGVLVELGQSDPEVGEIWADSRQAFYRRIAQSLSRGIDAGALRTDADVRIAAELLGSMTEFYAFQRFVLDDAATRDVPIGESTRVLAEIWTRGVVQPR